MAAAKFMTEEQARRLGSFVDPFRNESECYAEAAMRKIVEQEREIVILRDKVRKPEGTWPWALERLRSGGKVRQSCWRSAERIWCKSNGVIMWSWADKDEEACFSLESFDATDWEEAK